jgi:hypothetical protein
MGFGFDSVCLLSSIELNHGTLFDGRHDRERRRFTIR